MADLMTAELPVAFVAPVLTASCDLQRIAHSQAPATAVLARGDGAAAVARLVDQINARLQARQGTDQVDRVRLLNELAQVEARLEGLRRFIEQGDVSARVREWLREAEQLAAQVQERLARLSERERPASLQVHPARVRAYLDDLLGTLAKGGARPRLQLQADVERIVVHPVRSEAAKPFARAEVVTTGKGLLDRVAFVVAGARIRLWKRPPLDFDFVLRY